MRSVSTRMPGQHRGREPRDRARLLQRPRHEAVEQVEVVGARRARVRHRQRGRDVARGLARLRADRRQRVRVALLRHQRARARVPVGQLDQPELVARVDLEVLRELREVRGRDRERREQLGVDVPLPGRVLGVRDEALAAEQLGQPRAVERPARAGAAAGAGDAARELAVGAPQALGVAQRRVGVGQQQVPGGRRLGRLQVGVVGGERVAQRARVHAPARPRRRRARRRARRRRGASRRAARRGRPRGAAVPRSASRRRRGPMRRTSSASRELNASPSCGLPGKLGRPGWRAARAGRRAARAPSRRAARRSRRARRRARCRTARGRRRAAARRAARARRRPRRARRPGRPRAVRPRRDSRRQPCGASLRWPPPRTWERWDTAPHALLLCAQLG